MIKPNELRIGNYVYDESDKWPGGFIDNGKRVKRVRHIDENYVKLEKPIPLTEEWLLKFGFKRGSEIRDRNVFYLGRFSISISNLQCGYTDKTGKLFVCPIHIEYIHQLQNLIFALTGEELTFSDSKIKV